MCDCLMSSELERQSKTHKRQPKKRKHTGSDSDSDSGEDAESEESDGGLDSEEGQHATSLSIHPALLACCLAFGTGTHTHVLRYTIHHWIPLGVIITSCLFHASSPLLNSTSLLWPCLRETAANCAWAY